MKISSKLHLVNFRVRRTRFRFKRCNMIWSTKKAAEREVSAAGGILNINLINMIDIKFTVNGIQQKVDGDIGLF